MGGYQNLCSLLRHRIWTSGRIQTEKYGFKVFAVPSALLNEFSGHFTVQLDQICNIGSIFMAIQLIVGQGVTHNRIFLRKCARWSNPYTQAETSSPGRNCHVSLPVSF